MEDGVWLYEPKTHTLQSHLADDIRAATGLQDFIAAAPLNLVYVAHGERMTDVSPEDRRLYASVDTGFIEIVRGIASRCHLESASVRRLPCINLANDRKLRASSGYRFGGLWLEARS